MVNTNKASIVPPAMRIKLVQPVVASVAGIGVGVMVRESGIAWVGVGVEGARVGEGIPGMGVKVGVKVGVLVG